MNKDVIYVEPEDDITDIILKIENAKEKIVALVPPKKAGVFRSVVNIKLIAKAGVTSEKTVVLVTVDPSILKLAAATKLPVAKDLNSAPTVPTLNAEETPDEEEEEELVEEEDGTVETEEAEEEEETSEPKKAEEEPEEEEEDEEEEEEEKKPKKKEKKTKKKKRSLFGWIKAHKILSACIGVGILALAGLLVWMLFIAPAVDVVVAIKTDQKNFSENVTFTDKVEEEDAKEGKFYLEQKKIEIPQEKEFEATGKKNLGEKAHGEVMVVATVGYRGGTKVVNGGDTFTINGLTYVANNNVTMSFDGDDTSVCSNVTEKTTIQEFKTQGCRIYAKVGVTAAAGGAKYNISASEKGWNTVADVAVYSDAPMSGGTDNEITVVQQSDIINAQNELTSMKEEEIKDKLYDTIDDNYYVIDSSFELNTSETTATPAADEEVKEGVKPTIKTTTTATVYVIDKVKLEEFIKNKADLEDNQKIYDIKDIYVENMAHIAVGATTKLKAQYYVGPKITESEVVDKIKGKGMGDAQREIRDIYGVSDVTINPSYSWVVMIPNDSNKVNVRFEVKDQDGNEIKNEEETENSEEESGEESEEETKKDEKE